MLDDTPQTKETKQLIFVWVILIGMATFAVYFFLAQKGIRLDEINLLSRDEIITPSSESEYPRLIKVTSKAFEDQAVIPDRYTCRGENISPQLSISGVPQGAKSLVLIIEDPDAPYKTWTHWVVFNVNPNLSQFYESSHPWGSILGENDFGVGEYRGPCPPLGKHSYSFKIYALDIKLDLEKGTNVVKVEKEMKGHILDEGELVGVFEK